MRVESWGFCYDHNIFEYEYIETIYTIIYCILGKFLEKLKLLLLQYQNMFIFISLLFSIHKVID